MAAPDLFLQRVLRLSAFEKHGGDVDTGLFCGAAEANWTTHLRT